MKQTPKLFRQLAAISVLVAVCCCAEVDKLRDAQAAFSDAATAENQVRLAAYTKVSGASDSVGDLTVRASSGYGRVIALLQSLTLDETRKLQADKLLGVATTIKAMSYWRLKDYTNASKTAAEAAQSPDLYPRDRAIVAAMPGLIRISQANDDIFLSGAGAPEQKDPVKIDGLLSDAIKALDAALAGVTPNDPVYVYLLEAELSAYKNKEDMLVNLPPGPPPAKRALTSDEIKDAQAKLGRLACAMQKNSPKEVAVPVIVFWAHIIGLDQPQTDPAACQ